MWVCVGVRVCGGACVWVCVFSIGGHSVGPTVLKFAAGFDFATGWSFTVGWDFEAGG